MDESWVRRTVVDNLDLEKGGNPSVEGLSNTILESGRVMGLKIMVDNLRMWGSPGMKAGVG